jgi:zinc-binding alcohol dehydrogenase family protein
MRGVGYQIPQSIDGVTALVNFDLPCPTPTGRDLLVKVKAVSVNPVDTKIRASVKPATNHWQVLGWDAAGIVIAVGEQAALFKPGDEVFYAGDINRSGSNAEYHLVDERIVGRKPKSLDFPAAAALPLTSITAWEMLFDRLEVTRPVTGAENAIIIVGGAGGVGSMAIQITRALTNLTTIATASRPETLQWAKSLGAHHVIDHSKPLDTQIKALGINEPAFVLSTTNTDNHIVEIVELIAPQGRLGVTDEPRELNTLSMKRKSISLHRELTFTSSLFTAGNDEKQHNLLNRIGELVEAGKLKSTLNENFGTINADNLRRAHALIESGKARGKIVLAGF